METERIRTVVRTIDGNEVFSDHWHVNKDDLDKLKKEFKEIGRNLRSACLSYLEVEVEGQTVYFNPDNIISIRME